MSETDLQQSAQSQDDRAILSAAAIAAAAAVVAIAAIAAAVVTRASLPWKQGHFAHQGKAKKVFTGQWGWHRCTQIAPTCSNQRAISHHVTASGIPLRHTIQYDVRTRSFALEQQSFTLQWILQCLSGWPTGKDAWGLSQSKTTTKPSYFR
jgi:hypothetical protein